MKEITYPVDCPLLQKPIPMDICFDIHCVIDSGTPKYFAPKEIFEVENYEDICHSCPYHRDD